MIAEIYSSLYIGYICLHLQTNAILDNLTLFIDSYMFSALFSNVSKYKNKNKVFYMTSGFSRWREYHFEFFYDMNEKRVSIS